jgi:acetylornithine deacetylase/succinyl-diaminopimelate desuccinylase-like protein
MKHLPRAILPSALLLGSASALTAASTGHYATATQALDLAKQLIKIRSVQGTGNRTGDAQALIKKTLVDAGWEAKDVDIQAVGDTAYLIATWTGSDPKLKPLVVSGHLDVVEAKSADWQRDPFTPVVENDFLYGRGALDMKYNAALVTSSLIEMRHAGYRPKRTIVLQFSGDEETTAKTSRLTAERLKNAGLVINIDAGGGTYDEQTGKPLYWTWDGGEKTYNDFKLEVANPGGHSSAPRPENAIAQLSTAIAKISVYRFKPELNAVTKGYWEHASKFETDPKLASAMRAFAANPTDREAASILRANSATVGVVSTTCVPTMVSGGHAENALPQRATANINCRIFPGHSRAEIIAELETVIGQKEVKITDATGDDWIASVDLPIRSDFVVAAERAINRAYPGVAIIPTQSSSGSDSLWYRALGIPSYGASPVFIKESDSFAHGLNERVPLSNTLPSVIYFVSLFTDLSR